MLKSNEIFKEEVFVLFPYWGKHIQENFNNDENNVNIKYDCEQGERGYCSFHTAGSCCFTSGQSCH